MKTITNDKIAELNNLGTVWFYGFEESDNTLFIKKDSKFLSVNIETKSEGKGMFEIEYVSDVLIQEVDQKTTDYLKPIAQLQVKASGRLRAGFTTQENFRLELVDEHQQEWIHIVEWAGDGGTIPHSVSVQYDPSYGEFLFPNQVIISSNLSMDDAATENTLAKLHHISKEANIVIINNAMPEYGITTVNCLKERGYINIKEITISKDSLKEQRKLLENADLVILTGGNPWPLLRDLRETDALLFVNDGATIVGVSAGAMVLGKTIEFMEDLDPEYNNADQKFSETRGYDLFNGKNIIPHFDENYFTPEQIEETYSNYGEDNFILLSKEDEIINH